MAKIKRYRLTEHQIKPVIRLIKENYPAGMTGYDLPDDDYNSGIDDARVYSEHEVEVEISTGNGNSHSHIIDFTSMPAADALDRALEAQGADLSNGWDLVNATVQDDNLAVDVNCGGGAFRVTFDVDQVGEWVETDNTPDGYYDQDWDTDSDMYESAKRKKRRLAENKKRVKTGKKRLVEYENLSPPDDDPFGDLDMGGIKDVDVTPYSPERPSQTVTFTAPIVDGGDEVKDIERRWYPGND